MAETEKETSLWQSKRKEIIIGAVIALTAALLGAWLLKTYLTAKAPPPTDTPILASDIATLNLSQATKSHHEIAALDELYAELKALREEETHILPETMPEVPVVDGEVFSDAVWQKNAQSVLSEMAKIQRYEKEITAAYTKETEAAYIAQRDEINGRYFNAILNIRLKLDNQKALGYTQETVDELERLLAALQQERGEYQRQLAEQRKQEIADHVAAIIAEKYGDWRAKLKALKAEQESEALRAQAEAQKRNSLLMENQLAAMNVTNYMQKVALKQEEIKQKEQAILSLESHIFNDIASLAAKLAIMHHFTLVIADPATKLDYLCYEILSERAGGQYFGAPPEKYARVITSQTTDITEEIVKELARENNKGAK